jgi:hypothetical protein
MVFFLTSYVSFCNYVDHTFLPSIVIDRLRYAIRQTENIDTTTTLVYSLLFGSSLNWIVSDQLVDIF